MKRADGDDRVVVVMRHRAHRLTLDRPERIAHGNDLAVEPRRDPAAPGCHRGTVSGRRRDRDCCRSETGRAASEEARSPECTKLKT
jgi:hypothetical protein